MPVFSARSRLTDVLASEEARAAITHIAPHFLTSPWVEIGADFPLGTTVRAALGVEEELAEEVIALVSTITDPTVRRPEPPAISADPDLEGPSVRRGSALVDLPATASTDAPFDVVLSGPRIGNPFVDVELTAVFRSGTSEIRVGGFYDGDDRYVLRFLAPAAGVWTFETSSTARSLDGVQGEIEVATGHEHGPVRVADTFHFEHADGTPYRPVGTTAYAWTHQDQRLQEETLNSLAGTPFTKLRMGLLPKSFLYNENEPEEFVFERAGDGTWDTTRFDLDYFRHLEKRIRQLDELGIQADLILFHPYDRWGFADLGRAADDRYISYVVRRLSAFPNVWWSMANEYDLLLGKTAVDWDRLAGLVQANDPVGHPLSIHNWVEIFDYSVPWATHASIQNGDSTAANVDKWRHRWGKPVVIDEFGYEGDLDQGWGNLTAEAALSRHWLGTLRGGYLTHGETFYRDDHVIFWAKGGTLTGAVPGKLRFLEQVVAESPTGRLEPLSSDFDAVRGGVAKQYVLIYFADRRPLFRDVQIPDGSTARIDVLDTWNCTATPVEGRHGGTVRVPLPARPWMAIRLILE
ncbi:Protein of unknown function [Rathayibacter oskolensis]|uniref:Collagen-binding domain of a collagenase n=1 Tax=Rathayibacter oskolensis TaxID=1891671 RepID=A0A1X7P2N2_9MICO|nr:DUF5605 domain-containing protein [Rathayibacter oskolensis]SMH44182.1 Protein of unknown function [Rathayibacter oskolensis]